MTTQENLNQIHEEINQAALKWGRKSRDINLIAVSKRQSQDKIQAALNAGHRLFGENKVQEAILHWGDIKPLYPDLKLHLIGALQTNKIKEALKIFDLIETIDREKLAHKLGNELKAQNRSIPCFIQVNIGDEEQKSGIPPQDITDFLGFCRNDCSLDIRGLMCIPPADEPATMYFSLLQKMAREHDLPELSMGMSSDFEQAIALGASYIRVGTAIFGDRKG